jgi:hypothetical protein
MRQTGDTVRELKKCHWSISRRENRQKIGKIKRKVAKSKAATERAVRANELASHPIHARVHTVDEHERHRDGARGGGVIPVHLPAIGSRSSPGSSSLISCVESIFERQHRECFRRFAADFDHRIDTWLGI